MSPQMVPTPDAHAEFDRLDVHVALLTVFVPPHKKPIFEELAKRVRRLTVLISTPMEDNRDWHVDHGNLDVITQQSTTLETTRRHDVGFRDRMFVHIPWDTIGHLRRLRPDVIIADEFGFRTLFSELYAWMNPRTPLIIWAGLSEHTERGKGWMRWLLRKMLLWRADHIVVNGRSGARYLERLGMPAERILRFPYATIPSRFDQSPPQRGPETAHRLVFLGRLIELKGVGPFLERLAFWSARNPDRQLEFTIVGDGPHRPQIEAIPLPANLHLRFAGFCDYEQIADELERAGIFVFPSLSDDWGMAVNEGMQASLPILGSIYSQAVDEMISDGHTGWRFRTNHPEEIDRAIEAALATPHARLLEIGQNARARIEHRTPEYSAGYLIRAIRAAAERRRLPLREQSVQP